MSYQRIGFRRWMLSLLLLIPLTYSGCVRCREAGWREYKVFCGMSFQGGEVTGEEWQRFCDECVTVAFPDGYTALEATGYWKGSGATTARENSRVLLIVASAEAQDKVISIARAYRERFHQEAVLVVTSGGEAVFVGDGP